MTMPDTLKPDELVEPAYKKFRREAFMLAMELDPANFAGDLDEVDDNTVEGMARTLAIVAGGYNWTTDDSGRLAACVAGDQGYATTGLVLGADEPADRLSALQSDLERVTAERDAMRSKLFPYADETDISGMSWGGFYLIGNAKSIKELQRIEHRAAQLDQFCAAYEESVARERTRATTAEAALVKAREALDNIRELNMKSEDENGHRWANSDLIEQEIIGALSDGEEDNGR